ncbi:FMN-dependent NADH-azoreductase [Amylibacter sp. SFDW26]|uniref:FMN-dependent NADH-azoreductase n=1 Tax=Amylibacter sp. SFDW26 TaxID=2652722 RepID=UPI00126275F8|nr:NAD(P)H-dependent oxidoreductase [Amylibacter sp. SFDW26]KAB7614716.1 FMN-dependent NADH-azoreductase [Amylibacter sp. SFDW26]
MTKLLYIIASPRGEDSKSTQLAQTHIDALKLADPSLEVDTLDLWQEDLIDFDGDKAAAKMTFFGVGDMDSTRQSAWDQVVEITNRFTQADQYVFSVPMWNGGIPYKLKQYIDIITQPGLLFGFDPEQGYFGLLENKKASVFYTSGVYAPDADPKYGSDFHSAYLDWWLNVIGITDINTVRFQPSLVTADPDGELATALEAAAIAAE